VDKQNYKIENKPVFYEDWFRKGICFVNDIMSEDGKFLSIDKGVPSMEHIFPKFIFHIFFYVRNITITKIE
jgi:hypothetical protein